MWPFRRRAPEPDLSALPQHRGLSHTALYDRFVPEAGQADTVQGELLRGATRISHEVLGNGMSNWDDGFVRMAAEVRAHLCDGTFGPRTVAFVIATLDKILAMGAWYVQRDARLDADPDADEDDPPAPEQADDEDLPRLEQLAELWCDLHPEPIPRPHDPHLHF